MDRLRLSFSKFRADSAVVSRPPDVRYLCNFTGSAGVLLVEEEGSTLFTDSRYTFQAHEEVLGARVAIAKRGILRAVSEALRQRRGRSWVMYSSGEVTMDQLEVLRAYSGGHVRWVKGSGAVENLRAIKDANELANMRGAAAIASQVFESILPTIRPGVTELEVAAEVEYRLKRAGASGPSFETIVAAGKHTAWVHARPSPKRLRKNELVMVDQGAILRGYCSDMTRTVFLGRAPSRVRRLYRAVADAQEAAKQVIRSGIRAEQVDSAARQVLRRNGLARYFIHSTGHGLGLEVHELPRLGKGEQTVLQAGMVMTVEPGIYLEEVGGIRIEDDLVVTATGAESLTTASREFMEL
jgi:Xaa-Pro aminopeptidase